MILPPRSVLRLACLVSVLFSVHLSCDAQENRSTLTELRTAVQDASLSMDDRVTAYLELAPELEDKSECVALADLLLEQGVDGSQRVDVVVKKARALRDLSQLLEGIAVLSESIEGTETDQQRDLCILLLERGGLESRLKPEGPYDKSVSQTLDDLHDALSIAEDLNDIELKIRAHNKLGIAYGRYGDQNTAQAHFRYTLLNHTTKKQLALARLNSAHLLNPDRKAHQDTALFYLREARKTFDELNDKTNYRAATLTIGKFLLSAGQLDEAKAEYIHALNRVRKISRQVTCLEYLGLISTKQDLLDDAEQYLNRALLLDAERKASYRREAYLLAKLGKVLIGKGKSERAFTMCDSMRVQVENDAGFSDFKRATRLVDCWDCIGEAQTAMGEEREALLSRDKRDSCNEAHERITMESSEDGLQVLEWENRRKQRMQENQYRLQEERQNYLYAIVALLIGFAMFITYRYRFTQRQSRLISTQRQQLADRQRELIKANSDLEIALNHKAVFLSNMSHEIRTPLNAIVGMSNLATKEDMTTGARKYLRNIVIASSNLIDIVNDILDFSKLEAGKLEIAEEPFSVADALEVAENVMRISAEQKGLNFKVDASAELPSHLIGDSSRLNQVLINLIGNAIKFTLEGGVTLRAETGPLPTLPTWCPPPTKAHENWFVIRVKDTGIGIPDDKQEKIFESFNQGDQLKTRKFGGTGLGLSISKQIVELQGGVIWVESVEDEGSTFCFALPAVRADVSADNVDDVGAQEEIGPIRILIAEDNPFNVIVTEDTLKAELSDVTIGKAANGKLAFEKVRDETWDLVLMDIHMPEMSGLEATAAIRKLPDAEKARTLIVAMTASVLREETDNYMRHGMDGFVPKPFQADQLKSEIFRLQRTRQKGGAANRPALPPLKILIAEDNPFNVIVAEDTLRSELEDVTIGKAENGKVALDMVREGEWDIVLMDIAMPEMTGIEATMAIRKLDDTTKAETTIIAMTASVLKEDTDHYLKQGMNGFVPKPFKVAQLIAEIKRAHLSSEK